MSKKLTQLREQRRVLTEQYETLRSPYWDQEANDGCGAFRSQPPTEIRTKLDELREQIGSVIDEALIESGRTMEERLSQGVAEVVNRVGDDPQARAWRQYLSARSPHDLMAAQSRAQQVDLANLGGYLAIPQVYFDGIIETATKDSVIRRLARTLGSVGRNGGAIRQKRVRVSAGKGHEINDAVPADAQFGQRNLQPRDFYAASEVSRPLIRESSIESIVMTDLANAIREYSESWFHTGNGTDEAAGIFREGVDFLPTARWKETATTGVIVADELIDLRFTTLRPAYGRQSQWVMSASAFSAIRKLKDTAGQYIWTPSSGIGDTLAQDAEGTLLGRPVNISEFAPDFAAGALPIVLGNWQYYGIVDTLESTMDVLVDGEYGKRNVNLYVYRSGVDGGVMLDEAFAGIKVKA